MHRCSKCGAEYCPDDKFCGKCGAKIGWEAKSSHAGGVSEREVQATKVSLDAEYVMFQLGMVYYRKGKLQDAIKTWQRLLKSDPNHSKAQSMLRRAILEMNTSG